jgi:hypothetical protein
MKFGETVSCDGGAGKASTTQSEPRHANAAIAVKNLPNDNNCHRRRVRNGDIRDFHFESANLGDHFHFGIV